MPIFRIERVHEPASKCTHQVRAVKNASARQSPQQDLTHACFAQPFPDPRVAKFAIGEYCRVPITNAMTWSYVWNAKGLQV